jgi:hypothetical protein
MSKVKSWMLAGAMFFLLPALTMAQAPSITSPNKTEFVAGQVGAFTVTATGGPTLILSEMGALPPGVTFTASTGLLSGKAPATGSFPIVFTASNGVKPDASQNFTLVIDGPATITSPDKATFVTGQAGAFTVTATGFPTPTLSGIGIPPTVLSFLPFTGVLSSTAALPSGTYPITFTAHNGVGDDYAQAFILTVAQSEAPKFTSPNTASFIVGQPGAFIVTETGKPTPTLGATGSLPTGVTFAPATGVLSSTAQTPAGSYQITFTAHNGMGPDATQSFALSVGSGRVGGEIVRAVIGFEQIGASATAGSQSFLFDFYISRPIPIWIPKIKIPKLFSIPKVDDTHVDLIWGPRLRWWADVKVSSYPYTQKSTVATFAPQFAAEFGNQNLNKLAESAEFVTGPEFRLVTTGSHRSLTEETGAARFGLTWFAGVGATGPNNPTDNATVFQAPFQGSTQSILLNTEFPLPNSPVCPAPATPPTPCTNYVAFVPKSPDRFLQQWGSGFRLYSLFTNKDSGDISFTAPATGEVSIGQNTAVTEGRFHGLVFHADAMYPVSIGPRGPSSVVVFLFGSVNTALRKNDFEKTLTLIPAFDSSGNPISVSAAGVTQISVDSNRRDTYRIGVGIDMVTVWNKIMAQKQTPKQTP